MKNTIPLRAGFLFALIFNSFISSNASNSVLSTGNWYKLSANETGVYIITYNDLAALGISVSTIDPRNISLYGNGPSELPLMNNASRPVDLQEMAIEIKGETDGVFDVGDTIFFYNHSQMTWTPLSNTRKFIHNINHYSDSTYFFLTVGSVAGKRIADQQSLPTFTSSTSSYTEFSVHESEQINLLHSGKEWFGEHFDTDSNQIKSFPININNLTAGDSVFVNVSFAGRDMGGTTSTLSWELNGNSTIVNIPQIGSSLQDNFVAMVNNNSSVASPLSIDSITLTFQSTNVYAEGWLNYIEVNAIRNLIIDQSPISFRDIRRLGTGEIVKYNITANTGIKIWDVTSFNDVKNQLYTVNTPLINFNAAADSLNEYIAFDGSNYLKPHFIGAISNQNFHSIVHRNMIIIADKNFVNEATILAQYHQTVDNLSTAVVSSEQIFNEYGSGSQDPVAIRDFLRQIYFSATSSTDSLKYVLLFGDPSYDFRNILGLRQSVVPTYESDNSINRIQSFNSDDFYSLMDSSEGLLGINEIPDIAIGRIPVSTTQEAQVINKIISYGSGSGFGTWRTRVTQVCDDQSYNIWFKQADTLATRIENFNCGFDLNKIYIDEFVQQYDSITNLSTYPEAHQKIEDAFQQGTAVIEYVGQGGSLGWATERILESDFLDTVNNISNLPLIIAGSASFNLTDNPGVLSAGEAAMLNPTGGCIATICPARDSYSNTVFNFMKNLNEKLFDRVSGQWPTIGDAFLKTKQLSYADPYTYSYNFLGDPAIRILLPENEVVVTSFSPDTIIAWQPIQITGEIHDKLGALMTTFNGQLDITLFNEKTMHMTLNNDSTSFNNPSVPAPFYVWDDTLYNATVNVINGTYSLNFIMPPGIDSGFNAGKIAFYANDGVMDAMGCYQNIVYKNLTPGIPEYSDLQIQIFPNPATSQIKCLLNNVIAKDWSYTLTGIDGRKLLSKKITSQEFLIERTALASGVYFLKIVDTKGAVVRVEKIIFE